MHILMNLDRKARFQQALIEPADQCRVTSLYARKQRTRFTAKADYWSLPSSDDDELEHRTRTAGVSR